MDIRTDQLQHPKVIALLEQHHQAMHQHSPPESVHALDISALAQPNIHFFSLWSEDQLAGIGALKRLTDTHGEIKSMRTSAQFLRQGVAAKLLTHIITQAKTLGLTQLSLETGTAPVFLPAQQLYLAFGFCACPPFSDYQEDPYSMYMTLHL